jgi:hypothetical protein
MIVLELFFRLRECSASWFRENSIVSCSSDWLRKETSLHLWLLTEYWCLYLLLSCVLWCFVWRICKRLPNLPATLVREKTTTAHKSSCVLVGLLSVFKRELGSWRQVRRTQWWWATESFLIRLLFAASLLYLGQITLLKFIRVSPVGSDPKKFCLLSERGEGLLLSVKICLGWLAHLVLRSSGARLFVKVRGTRQIFAPTRLFKTLHTLRLLVYKIN